MTGTVLIVDDEPRNVRVVAATLATEPCRLLTAASGPECLETLEREEVHLVLLDVMMPGMSGYEVLAKIREDSRWRTLPVILVTALREREDRIKGIELGADDFLSKPLDLGELKARVRTQLRLTYLRRQLSEKEKILKIVGDARDGIVITGRRFEPLVVNRRAGELLALEQSPANVIAHIRETFAPAFGAAEPPAEFLLERPATELHQALHLRCTLHTMRDLSGEVESHLLLIRDITEQYLEDSLRQDFLSLITHKFMTPLTVMQGYFHILAPLVAGTDAAVPLKGIAAQEKQLSHLMQRLLSFVQTTHEDLGRMCGIGDVDDLLREITERYAGKEVAVRKMLKGVYRERPRGRAGPGSRKAARGSPGRDDRDPGRAGCGHHGGGDVSLTAAAEKIRSVRQSASRDRFRSARRLEEPAQVLRCDTDPRVPDRNLDFAPFAGRADTHLAAVRGELQRVGQEVDQHLFDLALVGAGRGQVLRHLEMKADRVPRRLLPEEDEGLAQQRIEIHNPALE